MDMQTQTCLVLMFKAPQRSKQRLAAEIGARAHAAARHLLDCAVADLQDWPGPSCLAPAQAGDLGAAGIRNGGTSACIEQGSGNLGERIQRVNAALVAAGYRRQLFIGSDCPALDTDYLARADSVFETADVVLGPAVDGGVVLMGVDGHWPPIGQLPWSTTALQQALIDACAQANLRVDMLEARSDVDHVRDLQHLPQHLAADSRPSRRRLCEWIAAESLAC